MRISAKRQNVLALSRERNRGMISNIVIWLTQKATRKGCLFVDVQPQSQIKKFPYARIGKELKSLDKEHGSRFVEHAPRAVAQTTIIDWEKNIVSCFEFNKRIMQLVKIQTLREVPMRSTIGKFRTVLRGLVVGVEAESLHSTLGFKVIGKGRLPCS